MPLVRTECPIDGVAVVTLDRPAARNALSSGLLDELKGTFLSLRDDVGVRAVVLTGTDPAFSAGLDLVEMKTSGRALLEHDAIEVLEAYDRPIIGAVNGPAITGGLELALLCDLRIASERAVFADTHSRVGLVPGWGMTVRLPRAVGLAAAKEMSLSAARVDAERALAIGLVNQVVSHAELLPAAIALAQNIAVGDLEAMLAIKALIDAAAGTTAAQGLALEARAFREWNAGLDFDAVGHLDSR